jgi:DNA-binding MarR family transcriptional regulator
MVERVENYVAATLNTRVKLEPWAGEQRLPVHLAQAFEFRAAEILGRAVVVAFDRGLPWTAAALAKQLKIIEQEAKAPVLFVPAQLTPVDRARLIIHRVAFILPDRHMFLPPLGIDLGARFEAPAPGPGRLAIASQVVVINCLRKGVQADFQADALAKELNYTRMTMSRVFKDLAANGLAIVRREGRRKVLHFQYTGKELWDNAKGLLRSPVKKRAWVTSQVDITKGFEAGLSALAKRSNLASPARPVVAVPPTGWSWTGLQGTKKDITLRPQDDTTEVEIWAYPPKLLAKGGEVDPFSLYLSLRDSGDERVEQAIEKLEADLW